MITNLPPVREWARRNGWPHLDDDEPLPHEVFESYARAFPDRDNPDQATPVREDARVRPSRRAIRDWALARGLCTTHGALPAHARKAYFTAHPDQDPS